MHLDEFIAIIWIWSLALGAQPHPARRVSGSAGQGAVSGQDTARARQRGLGGLPHVPTHKLHPI